eukprot:TRINITY_DN5339_c0_g1_i1.p1 TRINITY_DN5339_c0_g1~~TRINITY_DN5339_c0_g1_i1.p1  ORF type:complete len:227 (-),score=48.10 TRINITY_DN5339_c0_g1_i1:30-710(-)
MSTTHNKDEWLGIESNPDVLNEFATKLGLDVSKYCFGDVWGLDDELLAMLPQPVVTMILLFPSKCKVAVDESKKGDDSKIFFLSQVHALDDACGTIAMVHSIANNVDLVGLGDGALKKYIDSVKNQSPEVRGQSLADNKEIHDFHHSFCQEGQTESVHSGGTGHHFVCFIRAGDEVVELDGCKPFPIHHGPVGESFEHSVAKIVKTLYMVDPTVEDFALLCFSKTP